MTHAGSLSAAVAHAFVDELQTEITIDGEDGRHFARVRRLRSGEVITLSDGHGNWRGYEIRAVAHTDLTVVAITESMYEPPSTHRIGIAPALIAKNRFDDMIVAAVELGVDAVFPFAAHRCVVEWRGAKAEAAQQRLQRLAREAAMQCRRSRLPHIGAVVDAQQLSSQPGLVIASVDGVGAREIMMSDDVQPEGWLVVSGPEGGLDVADLNALSALGPVARLRVGPHVVRAETAPLAAIAALNTVRLLND